MWYKDKEWFEFTAMCVGEQQQHRPLNRCMLAARTLDIGRRWSSFVWELWYIVAEEHFCTLDGERSCTPAWEPLYILAWGLWCMTAWARSCTPASARFGSSGGAPACTPRGGSACTPA